MPDIIIQPNADADDNLTNAVVIDDATLPLSAQAASALGITLGTVYRARVLGVPQTFTVTDVPGAFAALDWTLTEGSGAAGLAITILGLPTNGGTAITDVEYDIDNDGVGRSVPAYSWLDTYQITLPAALTSYAIRIRAVNANGPASTWSDIKTATSASAAGFTETGVVVTAPRYLTASASPANAPGVLYFVSYEGAGATKSVVISTAGNNDGLYLVDDVAGFHKPRLQLFGDVSSGVIKTSDVALVNADRNHLLISCTKDASDFISLAYAWQSSTSSWVQIWSASNGPDPSVNFALNEFLLRVFARPDNEADAFTGTSYRVAMWTFNPFDEVPDVSNAAVQNLFTSGASLVDPDTANAIYGQPIVDLNGNKAAYDAGTHDGSLVLTAAGAGSFENL